ncbi:22244_t:CDS:10 [Gigaspora margarita]|uniref:Citrate synthase n=1 Tax=Gigaspora margarita TaxID=4874 RepID=A0ABN7UWI8_GIGMA|nr:22244_t:CDS:10 [Gigaspora margarita]
MYKDDEVNKTKKDKELVLTDKTSGVSWILPTPTKSDGKIQAQPTSVVVLPRSANTQSLTVLDNRTNKLYEIPITNNTISALKFKEIRSDPAPGSREEDESGKGLKFVTNILIYKTGYPIEQLAEKSTYLEVAYLLIYGELPSKTQYTSFSHEIMRHTFVHFNVTELMRKFNYDAHPMGMFISCISAMNERVRNKQIYRLLGKTPTLAAMAYRHRIGRSYNVPQNNLSYTENFLYMLDQLSEKNYKPNPKLARALDILFILHADHELNCSTAAMRHIGSSLVDPYSAISGAAAALYGPLHGGANEAVLRMLEEIGSLDKVPVFLQEVKERKRKLFDVAMGLEKIALEDEYFIKRKLYPNVDFYSGLIYKAMGFPTDMFPVLFGWLAHWKESLEDKESKIWRPRQVYVGPSVRSYVPLDLREADNKVFVAKVHHPFSKRTSVATFDDDDKIQSKL